MENKLSVPRDTSLNPASFSSPKVILLFLPQITHSFAPQTELNCILLSLEGAASQIPSVTLALVIHMFNRVYVSASWEGGLCVHMHASAYRGWKKTLDPLELELTRLQAVVSHPT